MMNKIIEKLKDKNIAILGFGKEGSSTYQFIRKYLPYLKLTILDKNEVKPSNDNNLEIITGDNYLENLEQYDLIIKTPGISLKEINTENIEEKITSQLELFLEVYRDNTIGITGTKGKSTTTSLIYNIIKDQNENTILAGNIGTPILSTLENCNETTTFVIEMSSHQLEYLHVSPHIGIVLNLFEDHLDHAGTVEHYHNIKMNMFRYQTNEDYMIYFEDNEALKKKVANENWQSKIYKISQINANAEVYQKDNWIYFQNKPIYDIDSKRNLIGTHNLRNIMAALTVSQILELDLNKTKETIANFKTLAYRMENIGIVDNVTYVVDTLATIPEATIASIEALQNVNTLIFGGMDRGISYEQLIEYLSKTSIEHLICMPTTGHMIAKHLPQEKVYLVNNLEEAVKLAKQITEKNTICLLSPAASSYEQFKNYQEKGDKFKEYVYQK